MFPWRVAQSLQGFSFLLDHFGSSSVDFLDLRDRDRARAIKPSQWLSDVYPGIVIEAEMAECESGGRADGGRTDAQCSMRASTAAKEQRQSCQLCRKHFYRLAALEKHVEAHLQKRPCPTQCRACWKAPRSKFSCRAECACSPNHLDELESSQAISASESGHVEVAETPSTSQLEDVSLEMSKMHLGPACAVKAPTLISPIDTRINDIGGRLEVAAPFDPGERARLPEEPTYRTPTMRGWWVCSVCTQTNNPALFPDRCPLDGHYRGPEDYVYYR